MIIQQKFQDFVETNFCGIYGFNTRFDTPEYTTLIIVRFGSGHSASRKDRSSDDIETVNIIQTVDCKTRQSLESEYAEGFLETYFLREELIFEYGVFRDLRYGLGDIRPNAKYLVLWKHLEVCPEKWLQKNCTSDVLILDGRDCYRLSFESDDDYVLANLKYPQRNIISIA